MLQGKVPFIIIHYYYHAFGGGGGLRELMAVYGCDSCFPRQVGDPKIIFSEFLAKLDPKGYFKALKKSSKQGGSTLLINPLIVQRKKMKPSLTISLERNCIKMEE